jgi:hypothetical protein
MPISSPACHHVHPTGKTCGSPALRREQFCFYHHPTRRPPTRAIPSRTPFDVPAIVDAETLQMTLSEIIRRLADNTLDTKRASLLLITLQMAKANLGAIPAYPPEEPFTRASSTSSGPSSATRSATPDFSDLSGLLALAGLQPTPSNSRL